jgi:hypothetical protein
LQALGDVEGGALAFVVLAGFSTERIGLARTGSGCSTVVGGTMLAVFWAEVGTASIDRKGMNKYATLKENTDLLPFALFLEAVGDVGGGSLACMVRASASCSTELFVPARIK